MMKLELFQKTVIADIDMYDEQLIDKLDKIEADVIGRPCNRFRDFVDGVYEKYVQQDAEEKADDNAIELLLQKNIEEQEQKIISLPENNALQTELENKLENLKQKISSKEEDIGQLQNQLQKLSSELLTKLIDSAEYIEKARLKGKTAEIILKNQEEKLDSMLSVVGVTPIEGIGMPFDAKFQTAEELEYTSDTAKDGIVAESISRGFKRGNTCIIPQKVVVYKFNE